ncbi:MAG: desulfoferrodoxin [candidate division Zixibacteria bacterium]|nr:desulfoferrodoxin [candidate division Zixibacteria bacterium]
MTEKLQIYKCEKCGNMVEIVRKGAGTLVCCNQPMTLQTENTTDAAIEKHVPVIEKTSDGFKVTVGSITHPMQDDHFIEWIEVVTDDDKAYRKFLKPGDVPEAEFCIDTDKVTVREFCNLHGLWKA